LEIALVEDVFTQNRRLWVRLREKGGKRHAMPQFECQLIVKPRCRRSAGHLAIALSR
jgi:hypothetical protein